MKKPLILLSAALMLLSMPMMAQDLTKWAKNIEKAVANTENPKKASNPDTWVKLGKEYVKAYEATLGSGLLNTPKEQIALMMGDLKPLSSEMVTLEGNAYQKDSYACFDYYYRNNVLVMIVPTKSAVEDPLGKALDAFVKARELDEKGKKAKDIAAGIKQVVDYSSQQAYFQYNLGNKVESARLFEKAGNASAFAGDNGTLDGSLLSNAGLLYAQTGDLDAAQRCFEQCLANNFYDEEGRVFAHLSDIAARKEDKAAQLSYLKQGFEKFPSSQAIIIGLINAYRAGGEDPQEIFVLLDKAKVNDPNNASLYSTEGDIHKELKEDEAAIACYRKASEVDPQFPYGYVGEGLLLYERAIEYATLANEAVADADYRKYLALYEETMPKAIEPFEKAFELAADNPKLQSGVAEYLKNIYYRFSSDSEKYMAGYKKYNDFLKAQ
ncbi:MAG: tetratricopeptide repeat protein [Bacteroidales bacterium]|nr:tetratricopeptide repeat protein [Bacteroidales bacterium]